MKELRILFLSLSLLLLSSCSWFVKEVVVTEYVYIPVEISKVERPRPLLLSKPSFDVVSPANLQKFLEENKKRNGTIVFIAIDIEDYEAFSSNIAELKRYIEQQINIIEFYEASIDETKRIANERNTLSKTE